MLNIYQWFYKNIWPLKDKSLLVNYKDWKVIIQAPIGTWKSFFFFDAPLFSLYKSNERTIINKDSKTWETQLLFSVDDNYYLIIRKLKLTKTWKDSVKTYFYSISKDKNFIDYLDHYNKEKIIIKKNDILTLLNFYQIKIEDLTSNFKQEKEFQDNLNDILPPKEVATSTFFIQQDGENIFEVDANSRINVLKKIFGIMWIDDAKKIIDEKKRETYWMIKALWAEENFKDRFKKILENIKKENDKLDINLKELKDLFWMQENFDIKLDNIQKIKINIQDLIKENQNLKGKYIQSNEKYKLTKNNLEELENETKNLKESLTNVNKNIQKQTELTKKYNKQEEEIKDKKEKIKKQNQHIKDIEIKYKNIQQIYEDFLKNKNKLDSEKQNLKSKQTEFENSKKQIEEINKGINKQQDTNFDYIYKKIKKLEQENQINIDYKKYHIKKYKPTDLKELEETFQNIAIEWKHLTEKINNLKKQKEENQSNLNKFQKQTKNKEIVNFFCSKIENSCPFIDKIAEKLSSKDDFLILIKQTEQKIKQINQELQKNKEERDKLANYWKENNINQVKDNIKNYYKNEEEIKRLNSILHHKQEEQKAISLKLWEKKAKEEENTKLQKYIETIENNIKNIENEINFDIEKDYKTLQEFKKAKEIINNDIENLQKQLNLIKDELQKIKEIELEKTNIENKISSKTTKIENFQKEIKVLQKNIKDNNIKKLQGKEDNLLNLKENIWYFNKLVDEFNKNKLELIKIKEKYTLLKNLWNIFWKELIIYVFKDYIESLQSLINYFLESIVDFKLFIHLDESWKNLEIYIKDWKWEREVKSLSWWQKNALKIWWILWINKLKNSKLLFLDETINNFDEESVQLIANKIKEFINENNIKFYMVTHSQTLAYTDIWNDILHLEI